jgi:predicted dehydrogenase/threonine dehydrogenase-like Zn-dependent dehydrogenase
MKQVVLGSKGVSLIEVPAPLLEPGNVLVATAYSLISTGTEMSSIDSKSEGMIRKAFKQPEKIQKLLMYLQKQGVQNTVNFIQGKMAVVTPLGYSCSGIVVQVGEGITDIRPGDLVACAGAGLANHAEYVLVPRNLVVRIPDGVSLRDAASTTIGAIAMQGTRRADLRLGEWAAVIGLGLLGQITVQLLLTAGVRVIGFYLNPQRVEKALALGMNHGFIADQSNSTSTIFQLTQGHGVDAAILTAASKSDQLLQQAMEWTRKKGRVVVVGAVGLGLNRSPFYEKEIDFLISCSYGPGRYDPEYESHSLDYPYAYIRWTENRNMQEYIRLLAEKKLNFSELIEAEYPLENAEKAYTDLSSSQPPLAAILSYHETNVEKLSLTRVQLKEPGSRASDKIRVALVGAGSFAQGMHLPNLMKLADTYHLQAVVTRTGTTGRNIGLQFGADYITSDYNDVLQDPDVDMVMICTRHHLHAWQTIQAIEADKAVFLEKPMALSLDEVEQIETALLKNPVPFMVGFNRRFSPAIRRAKEILAANPGPCMLLYRVNAGYLPREHWTQGPEGGGRLIGEACHMLDVCQFLVGSARLSEANITSLSSTVDHLLASDNFNTSISYTDGSTATLIYTALGAAELPKEYIEIYQAGKVIILEDYKALRVYGANVPGWESNFQDKGHLEELKQFASFIAGKSPAPISLNDMIATTQLCINLTRSIPTLVDK